MIDVHCHLEYMEDAEKVIAECRAKQMTAIITSAADPKHSASAIALQHKHEHFVYATLGFHPHMVAEYSPEDIEKQIQFIRDNCYDIVGIGEVGLDYRDAVNIERQQEVFAKFIDLAVEMNMPLVVHCRDAFPDALKLLTEKKAPHVIFHCFSGSESTLNYILKQPHWFVSFATNVCYTKKHPRLASLVPLNRMLLETDSPWLDPDVPEGQKRELTNRPWKIMRSADAVAKIKGFSADEILATTAENTKRALKFV